MISNHVQALLLRPVRKEASVLHLLHRVQPGKGDEALHHLGLMLRHVPLTTGEEPLVSGLHCTVGFTYRGLEALRLPAAYLRVFSRLAPAFKQGAPLRAVQLGDTGESAPAYWSPGFGLHDAHVLLTLHGSDAELDNFVSAWNPFRPEDQPLMRLGQYRGKRLGRPDEKKKGEWVHFGFRDGLVDHRIAHTRRSLSHEEKPAEASDIETLDHAAGEFLLGHPNNEAFNPFALPLAPKEVRAFFHDSSFGVLRPMQQDVHQFEVAVRDWQRIASTELNRQVNPDWIRSKLCGRWPTGEPAWPQDQPDGQASGGMLLKFSQDPDGTGCPAFSHVRRMDPRGHPGAMQRRRPLIRRGMPYGPANWKGDDDGIERGLLGFFFCASIEGQFEQLLGQWACGAPPGAPGAHAASDPFAGQNPDCSATALLPLAGRAPLRLSGFRSWTRTLGTAYTWHPDRRALQRILERDYVKADEGGPWF